MIARFIAITASILACAGSLKASADVVSSMDTLRRVIENNVPDRSQDAVIRAYNRVVDELNANPACTSTLPPAPVLPVCEIAGAGSVGYNYYNFTISVNGLAIDGASSMDGILPKLTSLNLTRVCALPSYTCTVGGAGSVGYNYFNFTVVSGSLNLDGSSTGPGAYAKLAALQAAGICRY